MTSTAEQSKCACTSLALAMPEGLRCWIGKGVINGGHHVIPSIRSTPNKAVLRDCEWL